MSYGMILTLTHKHHSIAPNELAFRSRFRTRHGSNRRRFLCSLAGLLGAWIATCSVVCADNAVLADNEDGGPTYRSEIVPLLKRACFKCHSGKRIEAEIDLSKFQDSSGAAQAPRTWKRVHEMLVTEQMPPRDSAQLSEADRRKLSKWVLKLLTDLAEERAGDPGRVVLRRLSHAEYTYSIRDLTGVDELDPASEFPVDGAAGEGFTNAGDALVMSPSLVQKYLDAAKQISTHAAIYPEGIRFSPLTSKRDLTDAKLQRIREFYQRYAATDEQSYLTLHGINVPVNGGSRMPLEEYLKVTIQHRGALRNGSTTLEKIATENGLSRSYLNRLWTTLNRHDHSSPALIRIHREWMAASPEDIPELMKFIGHWQARLWKFNVVGHVGREGAPKSWMEEVTPITPRREFRVPLSTAESDADIVVTVRAGDAGDGNEGDFVLWRDMRLEAEGKVAIPLHAVAGIRRRLIQKRREHVTDIPRYLEILAKQKPGFDAESVAASNSLDPILLSRWDAFTTAKSNSPVKVSGHIQSRLMNVGNYEFVTGWGVPETPSIVANASDKEVRIPGISRPRSLRVHPSPTQSIALGWQSPLTGVIQIKATIADAHPECGNGVEWLIRHQNGKHIAILEQGSFDRSGNSTSRVHTLPVQKGDLISILVGPRVSNHTCDLTALDFEITEVDGEKRVWDAASELSREILKANPQGDSFGNSNVWHMYQEPMSEFARGNPGQVTVPAGSLVAKWIAARSLKQKQELAKAVSRLLALPGPDTNQFSPADILLHKQLQRLLEPQLDLESLADIKPDPRFGVDPEGDQTAPDHIVVKAPSVLEFSIPRQLAEGRELVVAGMCDVRKGTEATVQLSVGVAEDARIDPTSDIVCPEGSQAWRRTADGLAELRRLFPPALCYSRIVPVDEVVTSTLFHREDELLKELMLDADEVAELDRLWDDLLFISEEPLKLVVSLEQIREFSTQDRQDLVGPWDRLKPAVEKRAAEFRKYQIACEPAQLDSVIELADRAWRRPLRSGEKQQLKDLYQQLRAADLDHETSIRLTITRILTSPNFLYRREVAHAGESPQEITDIELASRLSYFLWSSHPDSPLRLTAEKRELTRASQNRSALIEQTRRMLKDAKVRRLANHFACQWLHVRDFDSQVEKNEKLYPEFETVRGPLNEEAIRFFEDMFRNDRSILDLLDSDHTFANPRLAKHYGIRELEGTDGIKPDGWIRVSGMKARGRGGVLGMGSVLASQSGASRTSPILRGNWVYETLLGERLPNPPANVPQLPDSVPAGLTARQLIERHSSAAECARCHQRVDPYGFALEQFDAIGRKRTDKADTRTRLRDGTPLEGLEGLRRYLLTERREDVVRNFCRKLLGYALGREVILSDEPLLQKMMSQLAAHQYRFSAAVETIVTSPQFRMTRGLDTRLADEL